MVAALDGVAIKLDRAAEHLEAINAGLRDYVEVKLNNRFGLDGEVDPDETGWQFITWGSSIPPPDPRLGAVLGDFVHNVRSGLDQIVWQLVKANGGNPDRTQWPVSVTENQWRNDVTHRDPDWGPAPTAGLSDDALELVRQFQPFQARRRLRLKDPLLLLQRLSNVDKHRTLHIAICYAELDPNVTITPSGYLAFTAIRRPRKPITLTEGAEILRYKLRKVRWPPPEGVIVEVNPPSFGVQLAFASEGDAVVATLGHLEPLLDKARAIHAAALALPELQT